MKNKKSKSTKRGDATPSPWKPALFSLGVTVIVGILLILAASLIAYFTSDPNRYIRPIAVVCAALTFLVGGGIAAKKRPDASLAAGAANGLLLSAIFLALSLLFRHTAVGYPAWAAALLHGAMILLSLLGAYITVVRAKNTRPRKRRKKRV